MNHSDVIPDKTQVSSLQREVIYWQGRYNAAVKDHADTEQQLESVRRRASRGKVPGGDSSYSTSFTEGESDVCAQ